MPPPSSSLKAAARNAAKAAVRRIPASERQNYSSSIRHTLAHHILPPEGVILAFAPLPLEPDLLPLIAEFQGLRFAFPRVTGQGTMTTHLVRSRDQLSTSNSPIPEPDPSACPIVGLSQIALALIPAIAFDPATGFRLGHGGGYYDRLLANSAFTAESVGIAFSCQLAIPFPVEPHDKPVSKIVTENGLCPLRNV